MEKLQLQRFLLITRLVPSAILRHTLQGFHTFCLLHLSTILVGAQYKLVALDLSLVYFAILSIWLAMTFLWWGNLVFDL